MQLNKWQVRNRIIRRLRRMQSELEQSIRDIERWNNSRLDAPPFDVGFEKVMLQCVRGQLEAWEQDDMESVNRWQSRMNELAKAVEG